MFMKKLALMQPYLFPYLGYFQLIHCVDEFVVYDDVQFIQRGWIHRNRILVHGRPSYIRLPLKSDASTLHINQRHFADSFDEDKKLLLKQLQRAYARAPFFAETYGLVQQMFSDQDDRNVATFVEQSLLGICRHLGISTLFNRSSRLEDTSHLTGQESVIHIAETRSADLYVNLPGGHPLYDAELFARKSIALRFLEMNDIRYDQRQTEFIPGLSIIDVLMNNSRDRVRQLLDEFVLTP